MSTHTRRGITANPLARGAERAAGALAGTAQSARAHLTVEGSSRLARAGQRVDLVGIVLTLVIVGVIAYVGLNVMNTTEQATELESGSEFANASADLTSGIASAFSLMEVVFIVLLLSGIIALLIGLRGGQ